MPVCETFFSGNFPWNCQHSNKFYPSSSSSEYHKSKTDRTEEQESINRPLDSSLNRIIHTMFKDQVFEAFKMALQRVVKSPTLPRRLSYLWHSATGILTPKRNNTDQKGILPLLNCCINKQFNLFNMLCCKLSKRRF